MRLLWIALVTAACGGRAIAPTLPPRVTDAPARDLAAAKTTATHTDDKDAVAKDPRVVDLDIIRISATSKGVGDYEMQHVATADVFKAANDAAKSGETEKAIS